MDPLVDTSKSTVILLRSTQEVYLLVEYLKSRGLPATAKICPKAVNETETIIVVVDSDSAEKLVLNTGTRNVSHIIDYDGLKEVEALLLLIGNSFLFLFHCLVKLSKTMLPMRVDWILKKSLEHRAMKVTSNIIIL